MKVKLSDLDLSVYKQIPLSIRLNNDIVEVESLPIEIQYIINKGYKKPEVDLYKSQDIFDIKFDISVYNDMQVLYSKKETLIEYIKNYLLTTKGKYPFDPEFGNNLKKYLQTKDTILRQKLLSNELTSIVSLINNSFNSNIQVENSALLPYDFGDHVEYALQLKIKIEDSLYIFNVS